MTKIVNDKADLHMTINSDVKFIIPNHKNNIYGYNE